MTTIRARARRLGRLKALLTIGAVLAALAAAPVPAGASVPGGGSAPTSLYFDQQKDTVPAGQVVDFSADTNTDVGPTPYYIQFWDLTAGTLLYTCGSGTHCNASQIESVPTSHAFVATVAHYGTAFPPPSMILLSDTLFVTWNTTHWGMSMTIQHVAGSSNEIVTADSSVDVGPTPYWIEIFQETGPGTGTFLYRCGSGTVCSYQFAPTPGAYLVSFLSALTPTTLPPTDTQASSNVWQE